MNVLEFFETNTLFLGCLKGYEEKIGKVAKRDA